MIQGYCLKFEPQSKFFRASTDPAYNLYVDNDSNQTTEKDNIRKKDYKTSSLDLSRPIPGFETDFLLMTRNGAH